LGLLSGLLRTALAPPGEFCDPLTEVLRQDARTLLAQAVEAEVASFLESHADKLTEKGHRRLVRHGHLPERQIRDRHRPRRRASTACPRAGLARCARHPLLAVNPATLRAPL